jgi:hypothetical protein
MKTLKELKKERNELGIELYTQMSVNEKLIPFTIYNLIAMGIIGLISKGLSFLLTFEYRHIFLFIMISFFIYELFDLHNFQVASGLLRVKGLGKLYENNFFYVTKFNGQIYGVKEIPENKNQKLVLHEIDFDVDFPLIVQENVIYPVSEIFSIKQETKK